MERRIERLNWESFAELVPEPIDTVLLPVGTVEAHACIGLGTDNQIPRSLAEAIAEPLNALIAPCVAFGPVSSLAHYPGSLHVAEEVCAPYVKGIGEALVRQGFRSIFILNGHGGNGYLYGVAKKLHHETGVRIAVSEWWGVGDAIAEEVYGYAGGHASVGETAMVQARYPETVEPERMADTEGRPFRRGLKPYPYPTPLIPYGEEDKGPVFDEEKARTYFEKVAKALTEQLLTLRADWDRI